MSYLGSAIRTSNRWRFGSAAALLLCMILTVWVPSDAQAQGFVENVIQTGLDGPVRLVSADINQDGYQDVAVVAGTGDEAVWYEHDGSVDPSFTAHDLTSVRAVDGPRDIHVADIDADGDQDIMIVTLTPDDGGSGENGELVWYENEGSSGGTVTFSATVLDESLQRPRSVSTADIDGDGPVDILVASAEDSDIFYYRSNGGVNPTFTRRSITGDVPGVTSARAGDLDDDGDLDIAATIFEGGTEGGITYPGDRIVWLRNDGDTSGDGKPDFTEVSVQTGATGAIDIDIADVNGDGALDLVSALKDDNTIAWYENDGAASPSFSEEVLSTTANLVWSVNTGDADGDGDIDIFAAAIDDNAVYAFANNGMNDPSFTLETVSTSVGGAVDVAIANIDLDDKLDVFAIGGASGEVLWFKNESTVLPVELTSFEAVTRGERVTLTWRTLSETQNAGFAVEQRTASGFEEIGYVQGHGTTTESTTYRYETDELTPGTHAFRLRQVDYDGTEAYSSEVEVQIGLGSAYSLTRAYPNPFQNVARMELRVLEAQHVRVEVFDYLGRRVQTLHDGMVPAGHAQQLAVDGQGLASGAYLVRAVGEAFEVTRTLTLVK
jgi:hypothetical protein